MSKDLLYNIEKNMDSFSKGQKLIAKYILEQFEKAAFMTASKLGSTVGISESTVVRFAMELGYEGYPELQAVLQGLIRNRLTAVQRIEVATSRLGNSDVLSSVLNSDIDKIRFTLEELNREEFEAVIDLILNAKNIYILGVRSSSALASFLGFYFNLLFENVRLVHTTSASEMFEQILRVKEGDVVIGISFPRYSKRTVKALQYAKNSKASVVAITDSVLAPVSKHATHILTAKSDMVSFVDSLVAPLSLINALIVAVALRKKDEVSNIFTKLENIWDEYNVYEKIDYSNEEDGE
jgi:DNA-binding MurR/RpiR family transcriptional regulator